MANNKGWHGVTSDSFATSTNFSDSVAPVNGDTIQCGAISTRNIATGLSTGLSSITLVVEKAFTKEIGAVDSTTGVGTYLAFTSCTLKLPRPKADTTPGGSPRIMVSNSSSAGGTAIIEDTAKTGTENFYPPVMLKDNWTSVVVSGGNVGFAVRPGETAYIGTLYVLAGPNGSPNVYLGPGVVVTTIYQEGGTIIDNSNLTIGTIRQSGGTYNYIGTGARTTIHQDGGTFIYSGTGTLTTGNAKGIFDMSQDGRAKTVTTMNTFKGSRLDIDNRVPGGITFTNPINHNDGIGPKGCNFITPAFVKGTLITQ